MQYLSAALRKPMSRVECFVIAALQPSIPFFVCVYCVLVCEHGSDTCAHMCIFLQRSEDTRYLSLVLHLSLFFSVIFTCVYVVCDMYVDKRLCDVHIV